MPAATTGPLSASQREEEQLVTEHLPIVEYEVASLRRRLPAHVRQDDLVAAGMAALALAARSFDPHLGVPFGRYAARRVSGALLDEMRAHDWASRSVRRRSREHSEAAETLSQRLGRAASAPELAAELGVPVAEVTASTQDAHRSVVLSWQALVDVRGDDPALPSSAATPEAVLLERERESYVRDAVSALPERLRHVVASLFFEDVTVAQLAADLEVTESRVSQLRTEALGLIRAGVLTHLAPERVPAEERPDGRVARRKASYYADIATRSSWRSRISVDAAAATG